MSKFVWFMVHPRVSFVLDMITIYLLYVLLKRVNNGTADMFDSVSLCVLIVTLLVSWILRLIEIRRRKDGK